MLWAVFQGVITLVSQGAIALVVWYGSTLIASNQLDLASLIAFMLYSITIAASVAGLSSVFGTVMQAVGASTRVFELMDRKPQIPIQGGLPLARKFPFFVSALPQLFSSFFFFLQLARASSRWKMSRLRIRRAKRPRCWRA